MKKKLILFISLISIITIGFSQTNSTKIKNYIDQYKSLAISEMERTGVPAAITLAQGILESQYGESDLCKYNHNHFGIKCKGGWLGDKTYHDDDEKNECFRSYPNAEASYKDHSDFLKTHQNYASLFQLQPTDFQSWAYGLKNAGYATEKDYATELIALINNYDLNQYTITGLKEIADAKLKQKPSSTSTSLSNADDGKEEVEIMTRNATARDAEKENIFGSENFPKGIFTINHAKVIFEKKGTSLLSIATKYHIGLKTLYEYNDLPEESTLSQDNLIYLEKKMKKGIHEYHIATGNETLHDICQMEGVRLENILAFNGLRPNMQPLKGEKIYLRSNAPVQPRTITAIAVNDEMNRLNRNN